MFSADMRIRSPDMDGGGREREEDEGVLKEGELR
jgi:hypothetical protein